MSLRRLKDSPEYYKYDYVNEDAQLARDIMTYTKDIVKSKGFWMVNILSYLLTMSVSYYFTFFLYYMDNILKATATQSVVIDLVNGLMLFLAIPIIPSIQRKYGTKISFVYLIIPGIIGFAGLYFTNSLVSAFIFFALIVITDGFQQTIMGPTVSLVIDEDWQRTNKRKIGYINALSSLVKKPASGIRAFIFGAILSYYGYDGTLAVQSESAITGLRVASSIVPLISLGLAVVVILLLPYSKKVEDEIIAKRIEMEEGSQEC
ncbi:MAG: MFS transporter [Lachnospiraceae bacterium]